MKTKVSLLLCTLFFFTGCETNKSRTAYTRYSSCVSSYGGSEAKAAETVSAIHESCINLIRPLEPEDDARFRRYQICLQTWRSDYSSSIRSRLQGQSIHDICHLAANFPADSVAGDTLELLK